MARPETPYEKSLRSVIMTFAEQHASQHNGRLPSRYRMWRELRAQGHRCAWSTLQYHWDRLVASGQIIPDDGLYWLPRLRTPTAAPPGPALHQSAICTSNGNVLG